ncbi:MAG: UV DNA damage repair endonuclease UvsE [Desulfuromonas sp.]|nr:MAG: UV DNA damage repair endonuclease UvsE [Desulfuromonas sp.]
MRFGLCCLFLEQPVKFRQTTAKTLLTLSRRERIRKVSALCLENANSLLRSVETVRCLGIGAFRVMSPLFPRYTHPEVGYALEDLPDAEHISSVLTQVKALCNKENVRLSFHPDQFIVLSSPSPEVVKKSVAELDYQAMLAEIIGADVINIHGGGVYGDKAAALQRFRETFEGLPERVKERLALENDDISYTVEDLKPVCEDLSIPLVYDVHHHRCNPDCYGVDEATRVCIESWRNSGRGEPYLHVSSPKHGWQGTNPKPHADYIDINDFPVAWRKLNLTVDVEAKAKELAVLKLMRELEERHL